MKLTSNSYHTLSNSTCAPLPPPAAPTPSSLKSAFPLQTREELQIEISTAFRTQFSTAIAHSSSLSPSEKTLISSMPEKALDKWVAQSVNNFLEMDLFASVSQFLSHAKVR